MAEQAIGKPSSVHIEIDPKAPTPPSEQIAEQIRFGVASGRLAPGDRLPSVRGLAVSARVNPNTVAKAYRELEREDTVETRRGAGVFVAHGAVEVCRSLGGEVVRKRFVRAVRDARASGLAAEQIETMVSELLEGLAEKEER
jgi:GntR family transcriptional regulator